jgi:hypothetical protein
MTKKKKRFRWKKLGVISGAITIAGLLGTYKAWSSFIHEHFTSEFAIEFHKTWNFENSRPAMTTPYRNSQTHECGNEPFDEVIYAEVKTTTNTRRFFTLYQFR